MGLFDFFKKKNNQQPSVNQNDTTDDFVKDMIKSADFFVKNHSARFKGLDYSVKSLQVLDDFLDEASDFFEEMNLNQQQSTTNTVGAYIFEVARRNYGGKYFWYDHLKQPILVTGQPEFEVSILAIEKVKCRLINGNEDNIPFYFQGFIENVQNKKSAMIV